MLKKFIDRLGGKSKKNMLKNAKKRPKNTKKHPKNAEKTPKKVGKITENTKNTQNKIGKYHVEAHCYNGGRVCEFLKKTHCKAFDFSSSNGEISFICKGVSPAEITQLIAKCGGENPQITEVGFLQTAKKRLPILVGIFLFVAVILFSNLFVFKVEVYGEDEVCKVHLQNLAEEIYPTISLKSDEKLALLKSEISAYEEVAFFTVEVLQNKVIINFLKAENAEIIQGETSLVAPENGTLISLSVLSGTAKKTAGESVSKGEILILAQTGGEDPQPLDKAMGSGVLLAEKTATYTFSQAQTEITYTGESESVTYFIVGENQLFYKESDFENFTLTTHTSTFICENIQLVQETRQEYTTNTVIYTPEELEEKAIAIFTSRYLSDFAYTITNVETSYETDGEWWQVRVFCQYLLQFTS